MFILTGTSNDGWKYAVGSCGSRPKHRSRPSLCLPSIHGPFDIGYWFLSPECRKSLRHSTLSPVCTVPGFTGKRLSHSRETFGTAGQSFSDHARIMVSTSWPNSATMQSIMPKTRFYSFCYFFLFMYIVFSYSSTPCYLI